MAKLETEYKQVILIREDLEMSPGKLAVQTNHATAMSIWKARRDAINEWIKGCIKVIVLGVPDAYELVDLDYQLKGTGLPHFLVTDLGVTEFGKPEITALGIGPAKSSEINKFTGKYKLYQPNIDWLKETYGENVLGEQDIMQLVKKSRKKEQEAFAETKKLLKSD
jgi:PTH2 family peptidyl-tRNA hydrolase